MFFLVSFSFGMQDPWQNLADIVLAAARPGATFLRRCIPTAGHDYITAFVLLSASGLLEDPPFSVFPKHERFRGH